MGKKTFFKVNSKTELFRKLEHLLTEQRNPNSQNIDLANSREIVSVINSEDKKVAHAVETKLDEIALAVDAIVESLKKGGRLLYFGAGTSGRLGVLDASECPPTFGTDPEIVQGFIAGGEAAMFRAQEGAEDLEKYGVEEVEKQQVNKHDTVVGLAASGRTPYVHGALKKASELGCTTIMVTTVSAEQIDLKVDILVDVPVGPEVIMGSTRMKSATAQKMILNMFTTGAMIRLGKIYENVMVDLQLTNKKLEERAKRIVMTLTGIEYDQAEEVLTNADFHVKTALVMTLSGLKKDAAQELLFKHNGFIRKALKSL